MAGALGHRVLRARPRGRRAVPAHQGRRLPGHELATLFDITEGPLAEEVRRNILHLDGEQHRRLRNLVNPFFTPRAADRWRPAMRRFLEELWTPLAGTGRCEAIEQLCKPYPSLTIATVMGVPLGGRAAAARVVELDPAAVRRPDVDDPA